MKLVDRKAAERRYSILHLLVEAGGTASESELFAGLETLGFGYGLTPDMVRIDLSWLKQRDLTTTSMIANTMMMAMIARLGTRVIQGRYDVPGLLKPIEQE